MGMTQETYNGCKIKVRAGRGATWGQMFATVNGESFPVVEKFDEAKAMVEIKRDLDHVHASPVDGDRWPANYYAPGTYTLCDKGHPVALDGQCTHFTCRPVETQPTTDHGATLAPGEIRRHTVGGKTFKIMHTGNGAYTQATVRTAGVLTTEVLATLPFESAALKIYATAIERAEAATPRPLQLGDRGESANWWERGSVPEVEQADEPENAAHLLTIIRDNLRRYVPGGGEQYLDRYLAAVAGAVPQRATFDGRPVWQHACGAVKYFEVAPLEADCSWCYKSGEWRALYTLGGK